MYDRTPWPSFMATPRARRRSPSKAIRALWQSVSGRCWLN
jgi:hypothetical protein